MSFNYCIACTTSDYCNEIPHTPRTSVYGAADALVQVDLYNVVSDGSVPTFVQSNANVAGINTILGTITNVRLQAKYECPCDTFNTTYCSDTYGASAQVEAGHYHWIITTSDGSDHVSNDLVTVYDGLSIDACGRAASLPSIPLLSTYGADGAIEGVIHGGTGLYTVTLSGFNKDLANEVLSLGQSGNYVDPRLGYPLSQNITRDRFAFTNLVPGQYTITVQDCEHFVTSTTVTVEVNYFSAIVRLLFLVLLAPVFFILLKQFSGISAKIVGLLASLLPSA